MEKIKVSEAQVKKGCEDYLTILQNQGKLVWLRLNSGDFIEVRGDTRRRVRGCPAGTADLMVILSSRIPVFLPVEHPPKALKLDYSVIAPEVYFIECKSSTGRQSPAQKAFQLSVENQGCEYYIIRDVEELQEVLK